MDKIGIFFGTNSGSTRLVAKKLARTLGTDVAASPLNVNRTEVEDFMAYKALILGTPSYGDGRVPSAALGAPNGGWEEFLEKVADRDMSGKTVALYGLGDQTKYAHHFVGGLGQLRNFFRERGAEVVGYWSTEGYEFSESTAVEGDSFCGLVIDTTNQPLLTDSRIEKWAAQVRDPLIQALGS